MESIKKTLKVILAKEGLTLTEMLKRASAKHGTNTDVSNMCQKLNRDSMKYKEAQKFADAIGYKIVWKKK